MRASFLVLAAVFLAPPAIAAADSIGSSAPAHPTCPPGSDLYMRNHGDGGRCIATECETDADCYGDRRCEEAALCIGESFEANSGARHRLASSCEPTCAAPARCASRRRCVRHDPPAAPDATEEAAEDPPATPTAPPAATATTPTTTAAAPPPDAPPPATSTSMCSAHAPGGSGALAAIVLSVIAITAWSARRRRRRR